MEKHQSTQTDISEKHTSGRYHGPWNHALEISVKTHEQAIAIIQWCLDELESDDWAWQHQNNFFNNRLLFYFNNCRDYTIFLLKYKQ